MSRRESRPLVLQGFVPIRRIASAFGPRRARRGQGGPAFQLPAGVAQPAGGRSTRSRAGPRGGGFRAPVPRERATAGPVAHDCRSRRLTRGTMAAWRGYSPAARPPGICDVAGGRLTWSHKGPARVERSRPPSARWLFRPWPPLRLLPSTTLSRDCRETTSPTWAAGILRRPTALGAAEHQSVRTQATRQSGHRPPRRPPTLRRHHASGIAKTQVAAFLRRAASALVDTHGRLTRSRTANAAQRRRAAWCLSPLLVSGTALTPSRERADSMSRSEPGSHQPAPRTSRRFSAAIFVTTRRTRRGPRDTTREPVRAPSSTGLLGFLLARSQRLREERSRAWCAATAVESAAVGLDVARPDGYSVESVPAFVK